MSEVQSAVGRVNALIRHRGPNDPATLDAKREKARVVIAAAIEKALADAPPLTPEQIDELSRLLRHPPRVIRGVVLEETGETVSVRISGTRA